MAISSENIGSDYDDDEIEFIKAVDRWRIRYCRKIPALTDLLVILKDLGYAKRKEADADIISVRSSD